MGLGEKLAKRKVTRRGRDYTHFNKWSLLTILQPIEHRKKKPDLRDWLMITRA